jgi:hypothetical protein
VGPSASLIGSRPRLRDQVWISTVGKSRHRSNNELLKGHVLRLIVLAVALGSCLEAAAGDGLTPAGTWAGKAQITSSVLGQNDPAATGTFDLRLSLTIYGDVSGTFSGNGCVVAGIAVPVTPGSSVASVRITLDGCANTPLNGQYEGNLTPSKDGTAKLLISGMQFDRALSGAARRNTVLASMSR